MTGIRDKNGTTVVSYIYDAWGNIVSTLGSKASTLGEANPLRYRGYVYDSETGLYYLQSRYYNPEWGRFINADNQLDADNPLGLNLFAYCLNNPVMNCDPSGHIPEWAMWTIGGVLLAASIVATILTSGAAAGTIAASINVIATGAMIGGITSAGVGTLAGGLSYEAGHLTWNWSGAAEGFMWGSITGTISGMAGSALSSVGNGLANCGSLGKLAYAGVQGLINGGISAGLTATQGLITNSFSWSGTLQSGFFGFVGGGIGISPKWGSGLRNILVGIGLGIGEGTIGEICEWYESKTKITTANTRIVYCP